MKRSFLIPILIFIIYSAYGQNNQAITKSGTVVNAVDNSPVQYIVVELVQKNKLTEKTIRSVLTNAKGSFQIKIDSVSESDTLFLIFKSFLYNTYRINLSAVIETEIGIIRIQPVEKTLTGVEVTTNPIKKTLGKVEYNVNPKDFIANSKATDVFQKIPLVTITDNDIKVKGKAGVMVFLDGRVITPAEMNLIPVENIKTIEVITNPSSSYDGEFKGAIINIVSKKKLPDMVKGTVDLSKGIANNWTRSSLYLAYKRKKYLSNISATILDNLQQGNGIINRQSGNQNFKMNSSNGSNITQSNASVTSYYDIDSSKQLSSRLSYVNVTDKSNDNGFFNIANGTVDTTYTFLSDYSRVMQNYIADLEYKKTYKGKGILSLSVKYLNKPVTRTYNLQNRFLTSQKIKEWTKINDKINFSEAAFNILRTKPLKKNNASLEYGGNIYLRKYTSASQYQQYDTSSKIFFPVSVSPSGINLSQNIIAAFSTYSFTAKDASFAFGSRIEFVNERFPLYHNNYIKILPNISAGYDFKKNRYLEFVFSQKLKRPGTSYLNPTVFATEPGSVSQGNISLKPENFYSLAISYNKVYKSRSNLNTSLYYEFDNDLIIENTITSSNSVIKSGYQNIGNQHLIGISLSFTKKIFKTISLNFNSFIEYDKLSSPVNTIIFSNEVFLYNGSLNVSATMLKKYSVSGFIDYTNKVFDLYSETSLPASIGMALRRNFFKNKFSATIRGMYFSNSNKRIRVYNDTKVSQSSTYNRNNNNLIFKIEYNFGKVFNDNKRRNIRDANDIKSDSK